MPGTVEQGSHTGLRSFKFPSYFVSGETQPNGTEGAVWYRWKPTVQSVASSTESPGRFHRESFPRPMSQNSRSQCQVCMLSYCDTHQYFTGDQKLMPDDISKYGASPSAFNRTMHCSHWESLSFLLYEVCCRALSQPK